MDCLWLILALGFFVWALISESGHTRYREGGYYVLNTPLPPDPPVVGYNPPPVEDFTPNDPPPLRPPQGG